MPRPAHTSEVAESFPSNIVLFTSAKKVLCCTLLAHYQWEILILAALVLNSKIEVEICRDRLTQSEVAIRLLEMLAWSIQEKIENPYPLSVRNINIGRIAFLVEVRSWDMPRPAHTIRSGRKTSRHVNFKYTRENWLQQRIPFAVLYWPIISEKYSYWQHCL